MSKARTESDLPPGGRAAVNEFAAAMIDAFTNEKLLWYVRQAERETVERPQYEYAREVLLARMATEKRADELIALLARATAVIAEALASMREVNSENKVG